jgi:hypothetical protein
MVLVCEDFLVIANHQKILLNAIQTTKIQKIIGKRTRQEKKMFGSLKKAS